jgi:hypothetical protein
MPRRLCIVSGNLVRCDAFIPALTSLSRDDELEIVFDRRRSAAPSEAATRPAEERRSRPYLDLALNVDGFALVPWSPGPVEAPPTPEVPSTPAPAPAPASTPLRFPPPSPLDRLAIDDEDEADRERLERILRFKPRRRIGAWALILFTSAIVVVAFVAMPAMRTWMSPGSPDEPRLVNQPKPAGQADETVVATQALPPVTEAPSTTSVERTPARRPLEPAAPLPEPSPRSPRSRSSSAPPRAVPPSIAAAGVSTPGPITREMSPALPGVPRVELSRASARAPEGQGETYTVRVSDLSGRPLANADILLLARMADGTAASIPLSAGAEPGTYQGTMPSGRSTLVDLRVRVTTSDKRVEIPFAP